jgi:hypothetical protein
MADPQRTGLPSQSENRTFSHDITIILYVCTVILADPLPKAAKKSPKPSFPLAVSITERNPARCILKRAYFRASLDRKRGRAIRVDSFPELVRP